MSVLVLELVYKTKEDIILGAHGKTRFLENIVTYNKEYYTDVLTGAIVDVIMKNTFNTSMMYQQ